MVSRACARTHDLHAQPRAPMRQLYSITGMPGRQGLQEAGTANLADNNIIRTNSSALRPVIRSDVLMR